MAAVVYSHQADNDQTPITESTIERSYGTRDVEMGFAVDDSSTFFNVIQLFRTAVIALAFASLVFHFIGNEYTHTLNILASLTALTLCWNICVVAVAIYFPQTSKKRSDNSQSQKLYRLVIPLNDAWLSGYIFMFTLWAKLVLGDQENGQNRYNIDTVFVLNCAIL